MNERLGENPLKRKTITEANIVRTMYKKRSSAKNVKVKPKIKTKTKKKKNK